MVKLLLAIVKAIQWVIEQGKCLLGLAKRVGEAVGPLVAGNAAGVAAVIFSVLGPVLEKLLGLLFKVLGITNISSFVKKAIAGIESRIKKLKDDIVDILTGKKRTSGKGCVKCKPGMKKKKTSKKLTGGIRGCGQCFVLAEDSRDGNGVPKLMGEHRMGQRIQTWLPGEVGYAESLSRPDEEIGPTTHRVVWFMQEFDDGHWKKFGLLRSVEWLSETGITEVGDWVDISELDEMGVEGEFQVMAIDPCPPIEPGPGRIITGEFHFSKGLVYNLRISGQEKPIRGTSQHPFYSVDRDDWVPMAELSVGERLLVEGGTTVVMGLEEAGEEPVCNIEDLPLGTTPRVKPRAGFCNRYRGKGRSIDSHFDSSVRCCPFWFFPPGPF